MSKSEYKRLCVQNPIKMAEELALTKQQLEAEIKVLSAMQSAKRFGQGTYDRGEISFMITTREAKLAELNKE